MLKIYTKLDDVPEALREHYFLSGGVYVPQLSDDHPVLTHNKTLLGEMSTLKSKKAELEADVEHAKSTSIPRGHIAVAKADADLLDKYKALGTVDDLTKVTTEHKTLTAEAADRKRLDSNANAATALGYNPEAFKMLPNLPDFEIRDGENGAKNVVVRVTENGVVVEKDAKTYIESNFAPFMPALTAKGDDKSEGSFEPPGAGSGSGAPAKSVFDKAREFGKQFNETSKTDANALGQRFGTQTA